MTKDDKELSFYGEVYSEGCPGCNRIEPQPQGLDIVLQTENFRVHQDYVLTVPGMMVIEAKRHTQKISDLSAIELAELPVVWKKTEQAVLTLDNVQSITAVLEQRSSHFHLWLLPIYPWMLDKTNNKPRNIQTIFDHVIANMINSENIEKVESATQKIKTFLLYK